MTLSDRVTEDIIKSKISADSLDFTKGIGARTKVIVYNNKCETRELNSYSTGVTEVTKADYDNKKAIGIFIGSIYESGSSAVTVRDAPSSDTAWIFPLCASVTAFAIASPRPKPPDSEWRERSSRAKRSNSRSAFPFCIGSVLFFTTSRAFFPV